jgi:hypothetical protein
MRFIAAINTRIYGHSYAQGAEIDITGWTRKQMLQFLNLGLMQASQITAGMITDAIVFTGAGVTTTVDDQGRLVVEITEVESALDDLSDVEALEKLDGQLLGWDEAAGFWKPTTVTVDGTTISLAELSDVDTTGALDGWTLGYHALSGTWLAVPAAAGTLAGLEDVDVTGILDGQTVIWDNSGEQFVPGTPLGAPGPAGPVTWAAPVPWSSGLSAIVGPPSTVVTYQGSAYVAVADNTGIAPSNTTYWRLIVAKGDKGDRGDVGPASTVPGPPGVGVPTGGTAGQALVKGSGADYDTLWGAAGVDTETVRDIIGITVIAGEGVIVTVDDAANTVTVSLDPSGPIGSPLMADGITPLVPLENEAGDDWIFPG